MDLATAEEAKAAIVALDGLPKWNWKIKVSLASGSSKKLGERRRLFIGGLPHFPDQDTTEASIRELFEGYDVSMISKLLLPRESSKARKGNHCYCFVELIDEEQTDKAILELDWKEKWDGAVRVKPATSNSAAEQGEKSRGRGWGR